MGHILNLICARMKRLIWVADIERPPLLGLTCGFWRREISQGSVVREPYHTCMPRTKSHIRPNRVRVCDSCDQ